jgi:hypothetical protein
MITALDSNVLIDILEPDPKHGPASRVDAKNKCPMNGAKWIFISQFFPAGIKSAQSAPVLAP